MDLGFFLVCFHVWPNLVSVWSVPSRVASTLDALSPPLRVFKRAQLPLWIFLPFVDPLAALIHPGVSGAYREDQKVAGSSSREGIHTSSGRLLVHPLRSSLIYKHWSKVYKSASDMKSLMSHDTCFALLPALSRSVTLIQETSVEPALFAPLLLSI